MTMQRQPTLRPIDFAIGLGLAVRPKAQEETFHDLGKALGVSASTVFQAVKRLQSVGLLQPGSRKPNRWALRNFVEHGARYAFPPIIVGEAAGVPTAHSGPVLQEQLDAPRAIVWPDLDGKVRGQALLPLYPQATGLPERAPEVYAALSLFDAVRMGRARERSLALAALDKALTGAASIAANDG